MNDYGKTEFDSIPIPAALSDTVSAAVRKGKRCRMSRQIASWVLTAAICLSFSANIPAVYTLAAQVPVLGNVVRIMHIGSGGTADQRVAGRLFGDGRQVYFQFEGPREGASAIPRYSVRQLKYPYGVALHLHNVDNIDQQALQTELERIPGVRKVFPLILSDAQDVGVTILLENCSSCVISELEGNVLGISFLPREPAVDRAGYLLCSDAMEPGAELAALHEKLAWEGGFQLPGEKGRYRIALGPYASQEQAKKAQEGIRDVRGVALQILPILSVTEGGSTG